MSWKMTESLIFIFKYAKLPRPSTIQVQRWIMLSLTHPSHHQHTHISSLHTILYSWFFGLVWAKLTSLDHKNNFCSGKYTVDMTSETTFITTCTCINMTSCWSKSVFEVGTLLQTPYYRSLVCLCRPLLSATHQTEINWNSLSLI